MPHRLVDGSGNPVGSADRSGPVPMGFQQMHRAQIDMALAELDESQNLNMLLKEFLAPHSPEDLQLIISFIREKDFSGLLKGATSSVQSPDTAREQFVRSRIDELTQYRIPHLVWSNNDLEWGLYYAFDAFNGSVNYEYLPGIAQSVKCIYDIFATAAIGHRAIPMVELAIRMHEALGQTSVSLLRLRASAAARAGQFDIVEQTIETVKRYASKDLLSNDRLDVEYAIADLRDMVGDSAGADAAFTKVVNLAKTLLTPSQVATLLLESVERSSPSRKAKSRWIDEAYELFLQNDERVGAAKAARLKAVNGVGLTNSERQGLCIRTYEMLATTIDPRAQSERVECLLTAALLSCVDGNSEVAKKQANAVLQTSGSIGSIPSNHFIRAYTIVYMASLLDGDEAEATEAREQLNTLFDTLENNPGFTDGDISVLAMWWREIGLLPEARGLLRHLIKVALSNGNGSRAIAAGSALALTTLQQSRQESAASSGPSDYLDRALAVGATFLRSREEQRWSLSSPRDRGLIYEKSLGQLYSWLMTAIEADDWELALEISELGRTSWLAQVLTGQTYEMSSFDDSAQQGLLGKATAIKIGKVAATLQQAQAVEEALATIFEGPGYVELGGQALRALIPEDVDVLVIEGWPDTGGADDIKVITGIWMPSAQGNPKVYEVELSREQKVWLNSLKSRRSLTSSGALMMRDRNHPWRFGLANMLLPHSLLDAIGNNRARRLAIVPAGSLWTIPFSALDPFGDRRYLAEFCTISLLPSVGLFGAPRWETDSFNSPAPAFAYLSSDLTGIDEERDTLRSLSEQNIFNVKFVNDSSELLSAMTYANRLGVIGAHGNDEPGLLHSVNTAPEPVSALGLLQRWAPETLVLGSCWSSSLDFRRGWEPLGLPVVALLKGAENVIVGVGEIPSRSGAELLSLTYRGLAEGRAAPDALNTAQLEFLSAHPAMTPWHWAGLTVVSRVS